MNSIDRIIEIVDNVADDVIDGKATYEQQSTALNKVFTTADESFFARKASSEILSGLLDIAFDYTSDNTPDLIADPTFSLAEVKEEIDLRAAVDFIHAYIARNRAMIEANLKDSIGD